MKNKKTKELFDYKSIKTYEDACIKVGVKPAQLSDFSFLPERFQKAAFAVARLMVIFEAINDGWVPDLDNLSQSELNPYFWVQSSGSGYSILNPDYYYVCTYVGSPICTDTPDKARYIAEQFESEYKDFMLL